MRKNFGINESKTMPDTCGGLGFTPPFSVALCAYLALCLQIFLGQSPLRQGPYRRPWDRFYTA